MTDAFEHETSSSSHNKSKENILQFCEPTSMSKEIRQPYI